jgi:uncharacterized delta-60 repeat protein
VARRQLGVPGAPLPPLSTVSAVTLAPDGKILIAGEASDAHTHEAAVVARLDANGSFDSGFGKRGVVLTQTGTDRDPFSSWSDVAVLPDGAIALVGDATAPGTKGRAILARLRANGTRDISFGSEGIMRRQLGTGRRPYSYLNASTLGPGGMLVIAGDASDARHDDAVLVARLQARH